MKILNNEEMLAVEGGAVSLKLIAGIIGAAAVFVIGVIDGIINPKKCN